MTISSDKIFYKHLWKLTIPLFLQQLLRISVDTINFIMLGSIDQIQMSALSQANQIFFVYFALCNGLASGCAVLVSQHWGKKDYNSISIIIAQSLRVVFVFGMLVSILVGLFPEMFMRIYSSDAQIIAIGSQHLRKVCLMYTICAISTTTLASSRALEQVRVVLVTNIISYGVNIFLDYILIFGKLGIAPMGIEGVAVGTIIARIVEFLICGMFFIKDPAIPFMLRDLKLFDADLRKMLFKVSLPIVGHELVWSLGTSSGAMITGQMGKSAVAGYNVTNVLYELCATLGNGYLTAASVVLPMSLGKGEIDEAKKQANSILLIALAIGFSMSLITLLVKNSFLSLYVLDTDALKYAKQFINIIAVIWPFSLIEMVTMVSILRSGGDGKVGFYTDLIVMWFICIPLAFLAFKNHAQPWMIVAIIKGIIVLEAVVGWTRVFQYKWVKNLPNN